MGYSNNPRTLEAMLPHLQLLEDGKACKWQTEPNEAHKLAYKIREALHIARQHPTRYPQLASVSQKFRIVVTSSREVQAIPSKSLVQAIQPLAGVTNSGYEDTGGPRTIAGQQVAASIIQSWMNAQPSNDRFFFPQANLPDLELRKLHTWATKMKMVIFVAPSGALTLQRRDTDPSTAEYAWSPEDLEGEEE